MQLQMFIWHSRKHQDCFVYVDQTDIIHKNINEPLLVNIEVSEIN